MDPQQARIKAKFLQQQREVTKFTKAGRYFGITLGVMVVTIYSYSMYVVKQETIMKEIDDSLE